jgi:hypothetical protein
VLLKWIFEMNGISNQMKFHPFADIFTLLEGEQFEELVQDIKARGLVSRIVLYEDAILDGRNRYKACLRRVSNLDMSNIVAATRLPT